jgi:hypothetical protein
MINRSKMPRQLRAQGGITNVTPREGFFLGGIKKRFRKIIPNELADVAVKAAPFVAPFFPGTAAVMRGIGRFDQRGSVSDALKQGALTYGFGKVAGKLGGAKSNPGFFGGQTFTKAGFDKGPIGRLFQNPLTEGNPNFTGGDANKGKLLGTSSTPATTTGKGLNIVKENIGFMDSIPIIKDLPPLVKQQILVGGVTGAATYIYEKFLAEEPPQEEGETYEQYMARRRENVGGKMRTYFDNYFKFDKDYSGMTDEQKDAFVARYNLARGGRVDYQTGGITMGSTLQQNVAANRQQAANIQAMLNAARTKAGLPTVQAPSQTQAAPAPSITTSAPTQTQASGMQQTIAPSMQQITSAMLSDQPSGSVLPSLPSRTAVVQPTTSSQPTGLSGLLPQLTKQVTSQITAQPTQQTAQQYAMPDRTGMPAGPAMLDPISLFSGKNPYEISLLSEAEQNKIYSDFDALPQSEKDNIDKQLETATEKQAQQFLADEKKFGSFADGRTLDLGAGRIAYNDLLAVFKNDYPNEFSKLTGNETLAELDQKLLDLTPATTFSSPASPRTSQQGGSGLTPVYTMSPSNISSFLAGNPQMNTTRSRYYAGRNQFDIGGRVKFEGGGTGFMKWLKANYGLEVKDLDMDQYSKLSREYNNENPDPEGTGRKKNAVGGIMSMPMGDMRKNKAGIMERDYRDKGGFVPVGIKEKADDVPAMLSKNEFVMTANAVRGAGNGSIEKGAQRMYDTMKKLEKRVV